MPSPPSTAGSAGSLITPPSTTARRPSTGDPGNQARAKGAGSVSPMYKANTPGLAAPNLAMRSSTSSPGMATGVVQVTDWLEGPVSQGQQGTKTNTPESLGHRMPLPGPMSGSPDTRKAKAAPLGGPDGDAWSIRGKENKSSKDSPAKAKASPPGFGDHFAPQKPWDSGINLSSVSAGGSPGRPVSLVARPPASKAGELPRNNWSPPGTKAKDVFDGLGLSLPERMPAPTLGEARKLRTGLAVVHGRNLGPPAPSDRSNSPGSAATMLMPSSSASQSPSLRPGSSSSRTIQTTSKLGISQDHLPAEARFPSLEELDATFAPPIGGLPPPLQAHTANSSPGIAPSLDKLSSSPSIGNNHTVGLRPLPIPPVGVRSAKVTGVAMRDSFDSSKPLVDILVVPSTSTESETHSPKTSRPSLSRRHRSSISVKHAAQPSVAPLAEASHPPQAGDNSQNSSFLPQRMNVPPIKTEGESPSVTYTAYLRDSPGKRVAHEQSRMTHSPQEATRVLPHSLHSTDSSRGTRADVATSKPSRVPPLLDKVSTAGLNHSTHEWSTAKWSPSQHESGGGESSSSVDEGPEDPHGYVPASKLTKRQGKKGRQSSVHDLVDLWGGAAKDREKEMTRHVTPTDDSVKLPVPTSLPKPHPSPVFPRSSSPQKLPAVDSSPRQAKQSPKRTHHRRDSKGSGLPSASPVRSSRPQSMFLFPMSKSLSDDRSPDTSASVLAPPAELKPRASRRTSITDMVQHYEAIDGKAKGAPAIATSSATLASTSAIVPVRENGRHSRIRVPSSPITSRVDALSRLSPSAPEKDASGLAKRRTSPTGLPNTIRPKELEHGSNLGPPTSPYRITTIENPTPGPAQPSPVRKSTEERPPSPDKPYQGVGKLINQWEGKTAEADPSRAQPRRRGGFVPKRTQPTGE
jgi:AP2-associated kinase